MGKGKVLREGQKIALVATGMMVQEALKATKILAKEDISVTVVDMPCIKPIDEELIEEIAKSHEIIILVKNTMCMEDLEVLLVK